VIAPPSGLPRALVPSNAEEASFALDVSGVLVYRCGPLGARYGWAYTAPDATLYEGGREVARHTSPTLWESTVDRSSFTAVPRATLRAGPGNLPWQLMRAAGMGETGMFVGITSVQQVDTSGGAAPAGGCDESRAGEEARVPFTARYVFYRPAGAG
jgi:hypothetical protein